MLGGACEPIPTPGPEEADRGDGVPSFAPFLQRGLDQGGKEKPRDGAESVISWESLPLHDEQRRHDNQDGGHDQGNNLCLVSSVLQTYYHLLREGGREGGRGR